MAGIIMPTNTKYKPKVNNEYSSDDIKADFQGQNITATAGETTIHDFLLLHDYLVVGAVFSAIDTTFGDTVDFQIIDKDNALGYGNNIVLDQYVTNWAIDPGASRQIDYNNPYPGKVPAGVYLRLIYNSVGEVNPKISINYLVHKILW